MNDLSVRTSALRKTFGHSDAVAGIDLAVPRGSVFGFLGPNGSGKTTTIRMLLGLISPTAGQAELLGHSMPKQATAALPKVGALVEGPAFHQHLSGRANLARLDAADARADRATSRARIDAAIERVGLTAAAGKRFRAYSLGMKQRLAIAAALLTPRELLILDEPTNGLDPQGTREVRTLVKSLAGDGTTVLLSTHLLSEVEQLCSHVAIMSAGRLVAQGSLGELRAQQGSRWVIETPDVAQASAVVRRLGAGEPMLVPGGVSASAGHAPAEHVVATLVEAGVAVRGFSVATPGLEQLFVELTGEGFDVRG